MAEIIQRIDKNNAEAPEMRRRIWAIRGGLFRKLSGMV